MSVAAAQRYTRDRRCPICGGAEPDGRRQGKRCSGFFSADGEYARCSREEHAGGLPIDDTNPPSYVHRLVGDCRCGVRHGGGADEPERPQRGPTIVAEFDYRDETGVLLFQVVRLSPKRFLHRRPDAKGAWTWKLGDVRRVLYRLPELVAANSTEIVYIAEGEKCVEALRALGLVASTNAGGTGGGAQWDDPAYREPLRGHHVVVLPDVDEDGKGRKHAERVARALAGVAASVKIVDLPGLRPPGEDVADWLARGGTAEKLLKLARSTARPGAAKLVRASDVAASEVEWLWPGRIPAGMLAVLDGAAGTGKSTVVMDLAARITTGRGWPAAAADRREPRDVILLGHEDSAEHTIRPRLDAAGADPSRVHLLVEIDGRLPRLPDDAAEIERAITDTRAALLVIDPISAYVGNADLHRDNEMRTALTPLVGVAQRTGAAIVMIRHLRKSGGVDAMSRGLGSVAISALARANMMLLRDPDDPEARVLAWACLRVAAQPASIRWRFAEAIPGRPPKIEWESVACGLTADEILERADGRGRQDSAVAAAERFLSDTLADGPVQAADLRQRAQEAGINDRTLKRARERLGVRAYKRGRTWWAALGSVPTGQARTDVPLGTLVHLRDGEGGQEGQEGQESLLGGVSNSTPKERIL